MQWLRAELTETREYSLDGPDTFTSEELLPKPTRENLSRVRIKARGRAPASETTVKNPRVRHLGNDIEGSFALPLFSRFPGIESII